MIEIVAISGVLVALLAVIGFIVKNCITSGAINED